MSGYVPYEVSVDTDALVAAVVADVATRLGITPNEGDPVTALAEVLALREAENRVVQADVAAEAFRAFVEKVSQVPRIAAASASMTVQFTATDTAGYTVPSGTRVLYRLTGSESVAFATTAALTIPPASTTGTVTAEAIIAGTDANDLPAATLALVDPLAYITAVASTTDTSGGVDAETGLEHLDRLTEEQALISRVPRLEAEFAIVARRIAGVYRARAIRGYDAPNATPDVPGHVTVIVVDEDGQEPPAPVLVAVEAELEAADRRALNVVVHVIGPTLQAIDVDYSAVADSGADPVLVEAAVTAAVTAYLAPGTWAGGDEDPPTWRAADVVRYLEVAAVINNVPGVDYVTALTLDGDTVDVPLSGIAVLPDPTVSGAVVAQ